MMIESRRLMEAVNLMKVDHSPLRTIARSSGFSSMRTFRRVFKKRFGMPPSEVHERLARSGGRDAFYHECIKKLSENWVFNSSRRYEESEEMAANLDRKNCILPKP